MNNLKWLWGYARHHSEEMGLLGAVVVALAAIAIAGALYFGAPAAIDVVETNGPGIPPDLADHQERAGMERGRTVGATPSTALPRPDMLFLSYTFKGSPNWSGRGTCPPQAVVLHVTGPGTMAGMASWFNNPASAVSAHFGIGKNGEVQQYVEMGDASWNAGIFNRPNLANPLIAEWFNTGTNPNRCIIGIELLLAGPAEPLVEYPKMQASLTSLLRFIFDKTGIPADRTHVIGHYEIDSVNRATDPRCCVNIDDVLTPFAPVVQSEWGECIPADHDCWHLALQRWFFAGSLFFDPVTGKFSSPPIQ